MSTIAVIFLFTARTNTLSFMKLNIIIILVHRPFSSRYLKIKNPNVLLPSIKCFDLKRLFIDRFSPGRRENGADVSATSKLSCVRKQWLWADNKSCIMCRYISLKLIFVSQRLCGKVLLCKERWIQTARAVLLILTNNINHVGGKLNSNRLLYLKPPET